MKKLAEVLWGPEVWCQGQSVLRVGETVRFCLIGALRQQHQIFANGSAREAACLLDSIAREMFPERVADMAASPFRAVAKVNDHPDTTFQDVAAIAAEFDRRRMLAGGA